MFFTINEPDQPALFPSSKCPFLHLPTQKEKVNEHNERIREGKEENERESSVRERKDERQGESVNVKESLNAKERKCVCA